MHKNESFPDFPINFKELREDMVQTQLIPQGVVDPYVLSAMQQVPRHEFVPDQLKELAYEDHPVEIYAGQTISQPLMVALMTEALDLTGREKVLEIGSGPGYQAAVLSHVAHQVVTIERVPELAAIAQQNMRRLGYDNVMVVEEDGSKGFKPSAPYDAIICTAGAPDIPQCLIDQLAENGRLVIPVGERHHQLLLQVIKRGGSLLQERIIECVFVPLIGKHGFKTAT